jgi:hypothetical protein
MAQEHLQPGERVGDHVAANVSSDRRVLKLAAEFKIEGLRCGEPAIIMASRRHRTALLHKLAQQSVDVDHIASAGALTLVDADELLTAVVLDNILDRDTRHVGGLIEAALARRAAMHLRLYTSLVEMLWRREMRDAAIQTEMHFYALGQTQPFSLLCAYAMNGFYSQTGGTTAIAPREVRVLQSETLPPQSDAWRRHLPIAAREADVLRRRTKSLRSARPSLRMAFYGWLLDQ